MYLFILLFSVIYSSIILKQTNNKYIYCFKVLPLFFIYTILLSFQDGVGTDYESYLNVFKLNQIELYKLKGEYLFYYIITYLNVYIEKKEIFFIIFYSILNIAFFYWLYISKVKKKWIMLFLCLSLINMQQFQINTLRTSIAIMFVSCIGIFIYENKKINVFIFTMLAMFFHRSGIFSIAVLFLLCLIAGRKLKINNSKIVKIFILVFFTIFSLIFINKIINSSLFIKIIPFYKHHLLSGLGRTPEIKQLILKYWNIGIYIYAILIVDRLNKRQSFFFNLGIYCYTLRMIFLNVYIFNRFTQYYLFFSIYPIYYLLEDRIKKRKILEIYLIVLYIFIPYFLKITILASGEYEYKFKYFLQ